VDNQLHDLRQFAAQRGFEVVAGYTDVGIGAEPEFTCPSEESSMWLFLGEKATQRACRWVQLFWFCCRGSKARRPGLDAMLRDGRKHAFNVLIVAAFDRVARSTKHSLGVVDELDSLGIEFISRRENIATLPHPDATPTTQKTSNARRDHNPTLKRPSREPRRSLLNISIYLFSFVVYLGCSLTRLHVNRTWLRPSYKITYTH
jgi:hypothetical protein